MKLHVKAKDQVIVIAGKDKGKKGTVVTAFPKTGKVIVEGVNLVTKHQKPAAGNPQGGIVNKESYIDISNVMYLHNGKPTRIGFKMDGDKKVRVAKTSGDIIG